MLVEDYLDAVAFREHPVPPKIDDWADDLRHQAGGDSFQTIG